MQFRPRSRVFDDAVAALLCDALGGFFTGGAFKVSRLWARLDFMLAPGADQLWQPVQGSIVDIQRLVLDPLHPSFGALRWLHGLPKQPFAPDQVFVTVDW